MAMVMVVIVGGWYVSLGKMNSAELNVLNDQISAETGKLESYRAAMETLDDRLEEFKLISETLSDYGSDESGENEIVFLYRSIDSICAQPAYKLDEITPSLREIIHFLREWKGAEAMVYIPIQIKIRGRYRPLANLVENIEQSGYFNRIEYCRIKSDEELYPDCSMEIKFIAGLTNRMGMFDFE